MTWTNIATDWNGGCAVDSRPTPPVDAVAAFDVLCAACEPFGRGLRYFSIPGVEFTVDGDQLSAPGDRLPGPADTGLDSYVDRMSRRSRDWRLRVVEPLFTDYRLWSAVRDHLDSLWSLVGLPTLAVASELVVAGPGAELCRSEPSHMNLVFVLSGTASLHDASGDRELSEGDAVRLAAAASARLRAVTGSLVLRLRVACDRRLPVTEAVRVIGRVLVAEAVGNGESVPGLPFPPPTDADEFIPPAPEHPPYRADHRAETERLTRTWWAGRASAAGLDPVPDPAEPPPLRREQRVRLSAPILVFGTGEADRSLWAVNGMAFTVAGPVPGAVLERLRAAESSTVADLCRDADGEDNGAEVLLDRLRELRAIDIVEEKP